MPNNETEIDRLRRTLRTGMIEAGATEREAREVVDIGFHAAEDALRCLAAVTEPLSGPVWLNAYQIALQLLPIFAQANLNLVRSKAAALGIEEASPIEFVGSGLQ